MFPGFATAFSGIQAGGRILGVGAHNIANAHTEDFKRTQATLEESSVGGVIVNLTKDHRPGPQKASAADTMSALPPRTAYITVPTRLPSVAVVNMCLRQQVRFQ